ncbi:MAG: HAD-IA family hydrolase [Hyphomicrobiales bacterium]|nr:HAD-IA family hydrolase [Hyphomicrobiales bacterium]
MGLLIFDCDGVLVDSEYLFAHVASTCLKEIGFELETPEAARRFAGVSIKDMLASLALERGTPLPDTFEDLVIRREDEAYAQMLEPIRGVREAILSLSLPRCVASSSLPERISASLVVTKLDDLFAEAARFSTALVPNGKPAPDIYLHAASRMGAKPRDCIVIEDSVPGVQGAISAGMSVIGFTGGRHCGKDHGRHLVANGAHRVSGEMADLREAVRSLTLPKGHRRARSPHPS